ILLIVAAGFWRALCRSGTGALPAALTSAAIASVGLSNLFGVFFPVWSQVGRSPAHPVCLLVGFLLLPFLLLWSLWSRRRSWILRSSYLVVFICFAAMAVIPAEALGIKSIQYQGLVERLLEVAVYLPIAVASLLLIPPCASEPSASRSPFTFAIE